MGHTDLGHPRLAFGPNYMRLPAWRRAKKLKRKGLFLENMEVAVEVHPSQLLQQNVSVQLS